MLLSPLPWTQIGSQLCGVSLCLINIVVFLTSFLHHQEVFHACVPWFRGILAFQNDFSWTLWWIFLSRMLMLVEALLWDILSAWLPIAVHFKKLSSVWFIASCLIWFSSLWCYIMAINSVQIRFGLVWGSIKLSGCVFHKA